MIELDEMWRFVQRKDNKVWIWKAYDHVTGWLVDRECSGRDERTFRRLFDRFARWKVAVLLRPLCRLPAGARGRQPLSGHGRDRYPGGQQWPAAALDPDPAAALYRHFQVPRHASRASNGCAVGLTAAACHRERDRASGRPVCPSARQQAGCS
ncbi:hypothetical protein JL100_000865 [Skermanella mucosa]|nr:hypothetical protein JL100_000865 [Skermanella mucosa]